VCSAVSEVAGWVEKVRAAPWPNWPAGFGVRGADIEGVPRPPMSIAHDLSRWPSKSALLWPVMETGP